MRRLGSLALVLLVACAEKAPTSGTTSSTSSTGGQGGVGGSAVGGGGSGGTAGEGGQGGQGGTAGEGGAGGTCVNILPNITEPEDTLAATGLYQDIANKEVAAYVQAYEPQFKLWSDGTSKKRWVYLPECDPIDNTDQDHWSFPVGTRMWKEFSLDGKRLETRMIHRYGPGPYDFLFVAYAWNDMETDGTPAPNGVEDVRGTEHDIPNEDDCGRCHGPHPSKGGLPSRYLGFSAIQLSHQLPGVTILSLSMAGALTNPVKTAFTVPGTPVEQAALGYMHANCANCHNATSDGVPFPSMDMLLEVGDSTVGMTAVYTDVVNKQTLFFVEGCTYRVAGGNTANSCVHFRMTERGTDEMANIKQMPPLASDVQDMAGISIIDAWIQTLPPPN